ncbi:hypothetical protein SAMN06265222_114115 [Neorhodopirellula lusitana]|uniref:Protein kinase domain-containing protein n=1 Tax=Neorhodopirellula lusitana TaxID=445327 RepID=A0ABY1QIE5_9BACT|nr:serine/threonine-protein kinase [Neorhodopirellula lusitana]SMP71796.1 hypothetical protein SAMN06265222_114115 [Neorhodopirellula lusitana]
MTTASEKTIFLNAIEQEEPAARQAYLDEACGADHELRSRVDALLGAHAEPDHALDRPPVNLPASQSSQHIGEMVGDYRLMEQIGEGGFGLVFVAQQERPVRRSVALKIIKPGTGSKEVIARFEAERQAVALMDHPNIARVFDAGVTDDGRPYFVMELVRGVPITSFADAHRLNIRQRLALLADVCSAVHHAHQKGVIHRDIKPSNVMVTLHDAKPVVKVIDFGVAKAVGQTLTDKTIYTRFFSMIGTPLYMSPEQAEMSGLDVDTRSDIYSLGVLMYELLAGATPFDRARLDSAGLDEMRRIIREEEPPLPSKRLSTLGLDVSTVSAARQLEPNRLTSSLRGDIDWIVMKALEKDRTRRYDSAAAMAADINRYLGEQPIDARPPTMAYQLAKFARRNRIVLGTSLLLGLTMLIGTGVSLWQMRLAMHERDQKEQALQEIEQFASRITVAHSLVANAQAHADNGQWMQAVTDFDQAVIQQPSYYLPWLSRADFYLEMFMWEEAADDFAQALELGAPIDRPQWWGVGALFVMTKHDDAYESMSHRIEQRVAKDTPPEHWEWMRNAVVAPDELPPKSYRQLSDLADQWMAMVEWSESSEDGGGRPDRPPHRSPSLQSPIGNFESGVLEREVVKSEVVEPGLVQLRLEEPIDRELSPVNDGPPRFDARPKPPFPPPHGRRRSSVTNTPRSVCEYVTGLAHLRSGDYDLAIKALTNSGMDIDWPGVGLVDAPLAMAYHHSGRRRRAAKLLQQSKRTTERELKRFYQEDSDHGRMPWFDMIEQVTLYSEACTLITGVTPSDPPELAQMRARALARLSQ